MQTDKQTKQTDLGNAPSIYRKGSFEARMDELLPQGERFTVKAFELWRDDGGGWSVNDGWRICNDVDRESAIESLRARWEVFKLNYLPKARVSDITDIGYMKKNVELEVDCTAFASIDIDED